MLQTFAIAALKPTPWKNGGGETREVAVWPPGAGLEDFDWRISIATIAASGPFSLFPSVDRHILLLGGDGVLLRGAGVVHRLDREFTPFRFSGDQAIDCELLGATSTDVNLMLRRGRLTADLRVLDAETTLSPSPHGLLLALRGHWQTGDATLAEGQGCWWAEANAKGDHGWRARPQSAGALLLAVRLVPAAENYREYTSSLGNS